MQTNNSWYKIHYTCHGIGATMGISLQWRHNELDGVSNHQRLDCLLNCWFRRKWKKTSKLRVTGLCEGNRRWPLDSPYKGPVTREMFPFDAVIMCNRHSRNDATKTVIRYTCNKQRLDDSMFWVKNIYIMCTILDRNIVHTNGRAINMWLDPWF